MLLSIGMIIKNEEKHLRDCLNGLKPLLENLQSELIICDTGSTDNSVEIAKEFTDKVYQIEWRDDFAWARNQTLKRAKGKWYMVADGDEVYTDVQDIIDFFKSGKHRKYNCATTVRRNVFRGNEAEVANTFTGMCLFRMEKDMRWVGKIHESMQPMRLPKKDLKSETLHYGYDFEDKDSRVAKHERNIAPLLEEFEKTQEKPKPRTILHLINEYRGINPEEEKRFIDIGLGLFEEDSRDIFYHAIYHKFVEYYVGRREYKNLVESIRRYFDKTKMLFSNAPELKLYETRALFQLQKFDEAAASAEETLDLINKNEKGQLNNFIEAAISVSLLNKDEIVRYIFDNHALSGNFDKALELQQSFEDSHKAKSIDVFNTFASYISRSLSPEKLRRIADIYDYAVERYEIGSAEYDNAVAAIERNLHGPELKKFAAEELLLRRGSFESDYMRLQRLRQLHTNQDPDIAEELDYFLKSDRSFFQFYGDILTIAIANNADFGMFLDNLHIVNSGEFFTNTMRTNKKMSDDLLKYLKASNFVEKCNSLKSLRIISGFIAILLEVEPKIKELPKIELEEIPEETVELPEKPEQSGLNEEKEAALFEAFIRIRHKYLSMVYKEEIYSDDMAALLSEQDGFSYFAGRAYICKDNNDTAGYAKNLRTALKLLPNMSEIIARIGSRLKETEAAPTVRDQLLQESAKLKTIIYTMINTGNKAQAAQVLESYGLANPTDPEIEKIREMLVG